MKRLTFILILLVHTVAFAQKKEQNTIEKKLLALDKTLEQIRNDWNIAGFSVAVVSKDKVIYSKGFGYRDLEKKLPADANTLFAIGSCSKAFTGTLIGQLVNEKKVDLDKPVVSYLPTLKFYNDQMNNLVTVRDMLAHTTGLPRHDISWYLSPTHAKDSLLARIQYQEPNKPIRTAWQYNNFMYLALGCLDEQITKKTWEQDIKEKIFVPLQMNRSNCSLREWTADANISLGYTVKEDKTIKRMNYFDIAAMSPAGAINSSANEMANWLKAWINDGRYEGKEVIPASYRSEAIASQSIVSAGVPGKVKPDIMFATYGFGWMLASYKGHYRVEHGGNIDGFSASTSFFPTDSIGIVVLTNQNSSGTTAIIRNTIADAVLGLKYYDWNAEALEDLKKTKDSTKNTPEVQPLRPTTHQLKSYVGTYANAGYGKLRVSLENDSLFIHASKKLWLKHNNFNSFDLLLVDPVEGIDTTSQTMRLQFNLSSNGDISSISMPLEPSVKPIEFVRELTEVSVGEKELEKYVGDYSLSNMTVKVYIKNNTTLYALVPGQPDYELLALGDNKFAIKALTGFFLQFAVDAKNKVSQVTFIQPNGNFSAKKITTTP